MLVRGARQLIAIIGPLILITTAIVVLRLYDGRSIGLPTIVNEWGEGDALGGRTTKADSQDALPGSDNDEFDLSVYGKQSHEVFSVSTRRKKYFRVTFGEYEGYNVNIIPHDKKPDAWIVVAQLQRSDVEHTVWFAQLVCEATFRKGELACIKSPTILPIAMTTGNCKGKLAYLGYNVGPHDARVFYGPKNAFIIYGSQSMHGCFGQWIQDLRLLTDWGAVLTTINDPIDPFRLPTELQRPPPIGDMEKNWFLFWDSSGQMYAHYDISPKRVFAQISPDGTAGPDLAPLAAFDDEKCMARHMPQIGESLQSIHQATNSLSVTLCKRNDPSCIPTDANTFIMTIFQFKTYYHYHSVYEPYVMLFKQSAPFDVHGISTKPIWIHGRGKAPEPKGWTESTDAEWTDTEMFYITSMSWKTHNQTYHGYIDDVVFLSFGIEDKTGGAIDVVVGDILDHMGLCADVGDVMNLPVPDMAPKPDLNAKTKAAGGASSLDTAIKNAMNEIAPNSDVLGSLGSAK